MSINPSLGITKVTGTGANRITTQPNQPAFFAYLNPAITNATGDGTAPVVVFNNLLFDQNNNYNTATGIFTAPVDGVYSFMSCVEVSPIGTGFTTLNIVFEDSASFFYRGILTSQTTQTTNTDFAANGNIIVKLTAAQTMKVLIQVSGSTGGKVDGIVGLGGGGSGVYQTFFCGALIC